jgi:hypothetical protein
MSPEITEEQITAKVRASHGALNRRQAEQVLRNQAAHDAFVSGTKPASEAEAAEAKAKAEAEAAEAKAKAEAAEAKAKAKAEAAEAKAKAEPKGKAKP